MAFEIIKYKEAKSPQFCKAMQYDPNIYFCFYTYQEFLSVPVLASISVHPDLA
jgi:hypothetical protein